ncbi:MAG: PadR family transcriptional regulator [Hyphomonadaceae bacterium]|nr:PadR family transcriptional regulator [Hyphomonadaceae bacterium]
MYHKHRMRKAAAAYMKMHGQHGRGGGRRRRPLDHGDLRLLILALIQEEPRHGYDLMMEIETRTGGTYKPSPGVMYPALSVLEDQGFVKAKKVEGKRVFNLTEAGEEELAENAETLAKIEERLESLANPDAELHPGDIRSASRRLRHTLIKTVTETWPDTSNYEEIVDILNQARADIVKAANKKAN